VRVSGLSKVTVPFAAWYEEKNLTLDFPEEWNVSVHQLQKARSASEYDIKEALLNPIGSKPLHRIAKGKEKAVIIVDDLTRPTPAHRLLPFILDELERGGIRRDHIRVVMGIAAHRPLVGVDLVKKLGSEVADTFDVINHNPYENLEYIGDSSRGTPIHLNGDIFEAEVKIGVGSIVPHPAAGFGGGGKIILPGVVSMETISHNHSKMQHGGHGVVEENPLRSDIEDVARKSGLDMIVNVVINESRQIVKVFAGDLVEAHRAGVRFGRAICNARIANKADILVANAYPIDSELLQGAKALWAQSTATKKDGTVVLVTAASEGLGHHYLVERNRRSRRKGEEEQPSEAERRLIVFSPNLGPAAVREIFPTAHSLKTWGEVLEELHKHGGNAQVTVLPCASIQCA